MSLVVATFALVFGLVVGFYWLFVLRPESAEKAHVSGRLTYFKFKTSRVSIASEQKRLSAIPLLEKLLRSRLSIADRLQRLVDESGLRMTVGTLVLMMFVGGAAGVVVGWLMSQVFVSMFFGALGIAAPYTFVRYKRAGRLRVFEEQFPEAIDLISRALRAGHAFTTGLGMAADEIPAPVGPEFKRVFDEQNFGMSLPDALRGMARRVPVLDARFFVTAVLTQRESGGNLSEVLDNLASVMRERFKVKRQIRVISAHGRISAWVLSCLAPVLAGVLFVLSPDFMRTLWEDPLGLQLVMAAVALQIIGTFIISRMVQVEY